MGIQLEWQEGGWEEPPAGSGPPRSPRPGRRIPAALLLLTLAALATGWWAANRRTARQAAMFIPHIDAWLAAERAAYLAGDVDAWLAHHDPDPAWRAAQFLPHQQEAVAAGQQVTAVDSDGRLLWATLTWESPRGPRSRVAFFQSRANGLRRVAGEPAFWGGLQTWDYSWGTLRLQRADADFRPEIADFIAARLAGVCPGTCPPLTVTIGDDFIPDPRPDRIALPSPRLVALDGDGQPAPLFWTLLEESLLARRRPAPLRFGVPDEMTAAAYRPVAARYATEPAGRIVQIVVEPRLLTEPAAALATLDGALLLPTPELISGGMLADLTPYVFGETGFDQGDFYAQIWDGAWWRDRMWLLPTAAQMKVIFYDRAAYAAAERPQPSLRWTWAEMEADVAFFGAGAPAGTRIQYGLLDPGLDLLYARAYTLGDTCRTACPPLDDAAVAQSLGWYREAHAAGRLLDLSGLTPEDRQTTTLSALSSRRQVAIWVEEPQMYENHLLLNPIGVLPFPAGDDFDTVTPLRVTGGVISQASADPQAVFHWIDFVSHQDPQPGQRLIPARPSVATAGRFWQLLPRPLDAVMRTAFPRARPVTIGEQPAFNWTVVADTAEQP